MKIQITTPQELQNINNNLSGDYELVNNISLDSFSFTKLGNIATPFTGTFSGNNFTISKGSFINVGKDNIGLFGVVGDGAIIDDLKLDDCLVVCQSKGGFLAGSVLSGALIRNCSVTNSQSILNKDIYGNLIGYCEGTVIRCYSEDCIPRCYSVGGGLIGYTYQATISNCYSQSVVNVEDNIAGGLIGYCQESKLISCYSTGEVSCSGREKGGLVGKEDHSTSTICYWDTETSGMEDSPLGRGCRTSEMQTQTTFKNWDFIYIWNIIESNDYPTLNLNIDISCIEIESVRSNQTYSEVKRSNQINNLINRSNQVNIKDKRSNQISILINRNNQIDTEVKRDNQLQFEIERNNQIQSESERSNQINNLIYRSNQIQSESKRNNKINTTTKRNNKIEIEVSKC